MYMKKFFILLSLCALLVPSCKNRGGKADAEAEARKKAEADAEAARRAATPQQQNNYPYQPQNNGYPQFGFPGMQ